MPQRTDEGPGGKYAAVRDFLREVDGLVPRGKGAETVLAVRDSLSAFIARKPELPEQVRGVAADHYARHLLYRDPGSRYEVVVMAWGPGQQTPIHDHAGIWCVEGVVEGTVDVTRYDVTAISADDTADLVRTEVIHAGVGQCGALIPPVEYHRIANPTERPAYTIHVYGGEMSRCRVFTERPDGRYTVATRLLYYSGAEAALQT